ncbi:SDR family NAD(P)-dependent oxidoreductase [Glaciecola sp. 2405UD65-10]|uniref:SDR family NAD(P)-dependent oxidoreductase n=1 Tax=Glaciecola sp. 2405UD65-10 TaxID=3397244 RepID=UPI003B594ACB
MTNTYKGKTAIISGAASGIGLALAKEFGSLGMNIVMADIEQDALEAAAQTLKSEGLSVLPCTLDVTSYEQWETTVEKALATFGKLHMVVNNAGVGGIPGAIEETNTDTWRWVVDVNLMGVVYGTQAATPAIKASNEGGWIINVASMAGMGGVPYSAAYAATKAAVVSMTESWAQELYSHNIHVSALCPAFVKTRIHESLRTQQSQYKTQAPKANPERLKKGFGKAAALVESGIPAELLAKRVVEALDSKQTYIFTHPNYRSSVAGRSKALDAAFDDAQNSELVKHLINDEITSL